jgi:hypothetical protein
VDEVPSFCDAVDDVLLKVVNTDNGVLVEYDVEVLLNVVNTDSGPVVMVVVYVVVGSVDDVASEAEEGLGVFVV